VIKSIDFDQYNIIKNILKLHCPAGIHLDPTYSKGVFYRNSGIKPPVHKFDLYPQIEGVLKADAKALPFLTASIKSIMFDPPFLAGNTTKKPKGKMLQRFNGFPYIKDLWSWYDQAFAEFHRILIDKGVLIVKCQDTISGGKQYFSHIHVINELEKLGFYTKDLFVLLAKSRMIGHNHANQKHARKFHSYFIVFEKRNPY